jgi:hypothetical protein
MIVSRGAGGGLALQPQMVYQSRRRDPVRETATGLLVMCFVRRADGLMHRNQRHETAARIVVVMALVWLGLVLGWRTFCVGGTSATTSTIHPVSLGSHPTAIKGATPA